MRWWVAAFALLQLAAATPKFAIRLLDAEEREVLVSPGPARPVFLHFWATWCPPCVEELPLVSALAARCTESVQTIAVNVGEDPETLRSFAEKHRVTLRLLADRGGKVWQKLDGRGLPTNYLWSKTSATLEPGPHDEVWWREKFEDAGCELGH